MAYKRISPIPVVEGGTGAQTLTNHGVLVGSGTSAVVALAVGTTGQTIMGSSGANPTWTGSPSFSGSVTAGTTLTATSGAITATAGNVVITSGNLNMPLTTGASSGLVNIGGLGFINTYGGSTSITYNTFIGFSSGNLTLTTGSATANLSLGYATLQNLTTGASNVVIGPQSHFSLTTGSGNTSLGTAAGYFLTTGSNNITIGPTAGTSWTTSESSNIVIGNAGTISDGNTIRIGTAGSGGGQQNKCFIAGINGVTVTGTAVLCSTSGQLGTISSSIRFKENIVDMHDESERIYNLRPVLFNFKIDEDKKLQPGLIAEEVDKVMPDLVVYDDDKEPFSVKYHELPVLLLNEIKKLRKRIEELERKV